MKGFDLASTVGYTMQAIGKAMVLNAVTRLPSFCAFRFPSWKPVAWLGVVSYRFYLARRYFILWFYANLEVIP